MKDSELKQFILEEYNELERDHRCEYCCAGEQPGEFCSECDAHYYTGRAILIRLSKKIGLQLD